MAEVKLKRYRYTGKERDEETGLNYHGARYYAPWLGRWVSCDPVGLAGSVNTFDYCGENPVIRIDPEGKLFWVVIAILAVVAFAHDDPGGGSDVMVSAAVMGALPPVPGAFAGGLVAGNSLADAKTVQDEITKLPPASSERRESLEESEKMRCSELV